MVEVDVDDEIGVRAQRFQLGRVERANRADERFEVEIDHLGVDLRDGE